MYKRIDLQDNAVSTVNLKKNCLNFAHTHIYQAGREVQHGKWCVTLSVQRIFLPDQNRCKESFYRRSFNILTNTLDFPRPGTFSIVQFQVQTFWPQFFELTYCTVSNSGSWIKLVHYCFVISINILYSRWDFDLGSVKKLMKDWTYILLY